MRQQNRKHNEESPVPLEIPPLKLPNIDLSDSPNKPYRSKDLSSFLNPTHSHKNDDFLREKSLYRYAISRKGSRNYLNKSQANLIGARERFNVSELNVEESKYSLVGSSKEKSLLSGSNLERQQKQRHFRRKTQNQSYFSSSQLPQRDEFMMEAPERKKEQTQLNELKALKMRLRQSQSTSEQQFKENLYEMSAQISRLQEENRYLRKSYEDKCKELEVLRQQFKMLSQENNRNIEEARRNCSIHSDSFITEHKLQNQMRLRDTFISQLQDRIKYLELENTALKKARTEKVNQESVILKLDKKNKLLQEKVRVLTKIKTKRNKLTASMISEFSDMSLNLSADDDEPDSKFYPELKTNEQTPDKRKRTASNQSQEQQSSSGLLSPLWKPKLRI